MSRNKKDVSRHECPKCGSSKVWCIGLVPKVNKGKVQRFRCFDCGKTFY